MVRNLQAYEALSLDVSSVPMPQLHIFFLFWSLAIEAWLSAVAVIVYMVVSPMLAGQIKAKRIVVLQEKAASGTEVGS